MTLQNSFFLFEIKRVGSLPHLPLPSSALEEVYVVVFSNKYIIAALLNKFLQNEHPTSFYIEHKTVNRCKKCSECAYVNKNFNMF